MTLELVGGHLVIWANQAMHEIAKRAVDAAHDETASPPVLARAPHRGWWGGRQMGSRPCRCSAKGEPKRREERGVSATLCWCGGVGKMTLVFMLAMPRAR